MGRRAGTVAGRASGRGRDGRTECERDDGERRGVGKDAYRNSWDAEGESEITTLAHLLETNFTVFSSFLPIHDDLANLLEML